MRWETYGVAGHKIRLGTRLDPERGFLEWVFWTEDEDPDTDEPWRIAAIDIETGEVGYDDEGEPLTITFSATGSETPA